MSIATLQVEGLSRVDGPAQTQKGHLQLPLTFDTSIYVGRWELRGARAIRAGQPEILANSGVKADGWAVWKDSHNKPCIRTLAKGPYILLFRPKSLQEAVQRIYGNVSRERMEQEQHGSTVAGEAVEDRGILTEEVLSRIPGLGREDAEQISVPRNKISSTAPTAQSAIARTKSIKIK